MTWYQVKTDTAIKKLTKAGSSSMSIVFNYLGCKRLTEDEVLAIPVRVAFLRHPLLRLYSLFHMFSYMRLHSADCNDFIPRDIVTGLGHRVSGVLGNNDHKYVGLRKDEGEKIITAAKVGTSDLAAANKLHRIDFEAFIDFILDEQHNDIDQSKKEHWLPQMPQAINANAVHKFEDINDVWEKYVPDMSLPYTHHFGNVEKDEGYRLSELEAVYAKDLVRWNSL